MVSVGEGWTELQMFEKTNNMSVWRRDVPFAAVRWCRFWPPLCGHGEISIWFIDVFLIVAGHQWRFARYGNVMFLVVWANLLRYQISSVFLSTNKNMSTKTSLLALHYARIYDKICAFILGTCTWPYCARGNLILLFHPRAFFFKTTKLLNWKKKDLIVCQFSRCFKNNFKEEKILMKCFDLSLQYSLQHFKTCLIPPIICNKQQIIAVYRDPCLQGSWYCCCCCRKELHLPPCACFC